MAKPAECLALGCWLQGVLGDACYCLQAIESSQAGGIFLNAECHELYGNPESAPELRGAPGNQSQPSELSKLADCLSTPFTADDKNLGELVKAESRAQALRARAQISERYGRLLPYHVTVLVGCN